MARPKSQPALRERERVAKILRFPLFTRWRFRTTGRLVFALKLQSTKAGDTVFFRLDGETGTRSARARSFLEHFVRI